MAVDPRKIFLSAEGFLASSSILASEHRRGNVWVIFPMYVNQAFACELYLKCILAIKTPQLPKVHKLHQLFDSLPKQDKATLVRRYKYICTLDPNHKLFFTLHTHFKDDLRSVLEGGSEIFSKIRYAYEGIGLEKHLAYLNLPIRAIRETIIECHPEWAPNEQISPPTSRNH